jgi:hypothetical protein
MNTPILDSVLLRLCAAMLQHRCALSIAITQAGHPPEQSGPAAR